MSQLRVCVRKIHFALKNFRKRRFLSGDQVRQNWKLEFSVSELFSNNLEQTLQFYSDFFWVRGNESETLQEFLALSDFEIAFFSTINPPIDLFEEGRSAFLCKFRVVLKFFRRRRFFSVELNLSKLEN